MGLPLFINRQLGRVRRVLGSIEQIGLYNGMLLYGNRLFGALFFSRLAEPFLIRHESPFKTTMNLAKVELSPEQDGVTFVIPTWNGMKDNLPRLLESVRAQSWKNIKIIGVDSESSDNTVQVLESFGAKVIPIKKADFRHDYARNIGAEHADTPYIVFTVQDANFSDPLWLETALKHLKYYGAKSFSSPQVCGAGAEHYARFLAYNFISANRYRFCANIFGNRTFGRIGYMLADPFFRQRLIHVDDTNHLTERAFFLKHRYTLNTCEDMEFGRKLILAGEKFVYSTLTSITHFHGYTQPVKYFTRVFLDNLVINRLTSIKLKTVHRDGIIDALFFVSALLIKRVDELFADLKTAEITRVMLEKPLIKKQAVDIPANAVQSRDLLDHLEDNIRALDDAGVVVQPDRINSELVKALLQSLGLEIRDVKPAFDGALFAIMRGRALSHMRAATDVLNLRLDVREVTLDEYRIYITHLMMDVAAATLAWYCGFIEDKTSVLMPRLKAMDWA